MKRIRSFLLLSLPLCLAACKEDVQSTYSNYPAYFACKNVTTVPPLNAALNNLGIYTTIRYDRNRFLIYNPQAQVIVSPKEIYTRP